MKRFLTLLVAVLVVVVVVLGSTVVSQQRRLEALQRRQAIPAVTAVAAAPPGETREQFIARNEEALRGTDRLEADLAYITARQWRGAKPDAAYAEAMRSLKRVRAKEQR